MVLPNSLINLSKLFPTDIEDILSKRNIHVKGNLSQIIALANICADENLLSTGDAILVKSPYFEQSLRNKSLDKVTERRILDGFRLLVESTQNKSSMIEITLQNVPEWLHQSEQYKFLLNDQEHNSFPLDLQSIKSDITVNNMDDFISLFKTCSFWGINYPETLMSFINLSIKNKCDALSYLYSIETIQSKLLIDEINDISFSLEILDIEEILKLKHKIDNMTNDEKDKEGHIIMNYYRINKIYFTIKYGDTVIEIFDSKVNIGNLFTYISFLERNVKEIESSNFYSINFYTWNSYQFVFINDHLEIKEGGEMMNIPRINFNRIDINMMKRASLKFIKTMKDFLNKIEVEYNVNLSIHNDEYGMFY